MVEKSNLPGADGRLPDLPAGPLKRPRLRFDDDGKEGVAASPDAREPKDAIVPPLPKGKLRRPMLPPEDEKA